ncbi:MAG: hypothetical protein F4W90_03555 [Gammaproteobacteria bacterium]|nr:hypothetical protein [Gammaproteobacteria bacterium]
MNPFLEKRQLGSTGLTTSRLGIGSTFNAPASAIEAAVEWGVNYLYWGTVRQPAFAEAMRNVEKKNRDELIFTIQSYSRDASTVTDEVEEALKSCGVERFDFLLLGSRDEKPGNEFIEVFERLKSRDIVRYLSISSHNRPFLPQLLDEYANGESPYELLMFRYNAVHRGAERDIFPHVTERPTPCMATYTSTRWGHLLDPEKMPPGEQPVNARDCYRYSLSPQAIDMVICGPGSAAQMQEAISALEAGPLEEDERERIERIGKHLYSQYAPAYPDRGDQPDVEAGLAAQ